MTNKYNKHTDDSQCDITRTEAAAQANSPNYKELVERFLNVSARYVLGRAA